MNRKPTAPGSPMTRRRFVTMVAAGSAALMASRSVAEPPGATAKKRAKPAPVQPPAPSELERQRKATADVLKTIRARVLPPGGELAGAFRPVRPVRKSGSR